MKRRSFLLGTGSAAAGGSALIGTGAFSRIDAQRSVTIQVAEDDNAYLGMNDCLGEDGEPTPNSSFADLDDLGHLRVDMGESGNGGSGVNSESISWFDNVFQLCNQGKEDVCLWISEKDGADPDRVTFYVNEEPEATTPEKLAFQDGDLVEDDPDLQTFTGVDDSILLEVGHCVCVGIQVYTREDEDYEITAPAAGDELLSEVSLVADVGEGACTTEPECAEFVGEYACTTYDYSAGDLWWKAQDTRFEVTNVGDASATFGWAIINDPDTDAGDGGAMVAPGETISIDPSPPNPEEGVIFWDGPEGCDLPTWGDVKGEQYSDRLVNHAEDTTEISDGDYVAEIAIPSDVEETEAEDRKGELDEIRADGADDEQALFDALEGTDVTACREDGSGDDPGEDPGDDPASDADLTFNDQSADGGSVDVENVTTNGAATLFVLYRSDGEFDTIAGLQSVGDVDDTTVTVDIGDDGGVPGDHEAIVVGSDQVSGGYAAGDAISNATDDASLDRDQGAVSDPGT